MYAVIRMVKHYWGSFMIIFEKVVFALLIVNFVHEIGFCVFGVHKAGAIDNLKLGNSKGTFYFLDRKVGIKRVFVRFTVCETSESTASKRNVTGNTERNQGTI